MAVFGVHFRSFSILLERFYSIKIFIPNQGRPFLSKFRNLKFLIFRFIYTLNSNHIITNYDELVDYHPLDVYTLNANEVEKHYVRMRYDLADCEK